MHLSSFLLLFTRNWAFLLGPYVLGINTKFGHVNFVAFLPIRQMLIGGLLAPTATRRPCVLEKRYRVSMDLERGNRFAE
jgi:hypothetical protein